tara:strand:+ start:537 stop:701 length:165 start_codon:yes stop_codon:yes gene_type:complete
MKKRVGTLRIKIIRERLDEIIRESRVASTGRKEKLRKKIAQYEKIIEELNNERI